MYLTKREAAALCGSDGINNEEKHHNYAADYSKFELMYEAYPHLGNEKLCAYVPRQKDKNSLLAEFVSTITPDIFFRYPQESPSKPRTFHSTVPTTFYKDIS
jgi:hypothetical protein